MDEKPKNLWNYDVEYQEHVTIPTNDSTIESENVDERVVYIGNLEKRKQAYGICGECKEPGTGYNWCQSCNAKRFKDNFKNWTKGGFGKIYSAEWSEGCLEYWDIENQKWYRRKSDKYALKSLNNSSDICSDFLNEIKSHLQIYLLDIIQCFGITQDPNNKEYMMVLYYCENGNLRNYLNKSKNYINYKSKIDQLQQIASGLLDIHNADKVHKDFHSGNILFAGSPYISDLGMCQPANIKKTVKEEGIYGVLPYMAPEVLRGQQYTKAADIYSFGIIINEFLSEEIPFNDIPHDEFLSIKICKGLRPTISKDIPKLFADLIIKCWDAEIKNRPTIKELYQALNEWNYGPNSEIYFQIEEYDKIREEKFKNRSNEDKSKSFKTHPQAIYTSRLINFKNLPKLVNSSDLSSFQFSSNTNYTTQSTSANPISECLDVQLSELELNEICQDSEHNIE
ncbi:kinase-like domain-containing protein [Rhizophagus irregularis DAOM 181602=DAOM 197198]|nr:kinase-like domain-containing protein [Rhizophagus irregularis DAOM 181602=DAOM 197198]